MHYVVYHDVLKHGPESAPLRKGMGGWTNGNHVIKLKGREKEREVKGCSVCFSILVVQMKVSSPS